MISKILTYILGGTALVLGISLAIIAYKYNGLKDDYHSLMHELEATNMSLQNTHASLVSAQNSLELKEKEASTATDRLTKCYALQNTQREELDVIDKIMTNDEESVNEIAQDKKDQVSNFKSVSVSQSSAGIDFVNNKLSTLN